jgi:uncharacterized protein (TIGR02266 family)
MVSKRERKKKKGKRPDVAVAASRPVVERAPPPVPAGVAGSPPTQEELVGALVEALVPTLFDSGNDAGVRAEEHRAHPRVAVAVDIGMGTDSHFFAGLSGDISEGGVFVQTYRDIPIGSDVEVRFALPEGELMAHGRVRWHRDGSDSSPPGVGIAFEPLREEERKLIHAFCARRAPLYYDLDEDG